MGTTDARTGGVVLLVENEPATVRLYEVAFREVSEAVEITAIDDGERALNYLTGVANDPEGTLPDVVVMDLDLPRLDGRHFLRAMAEIESVPRVPIVVMSGHDDQRTVDDCYRLGASTYLVKPDDYEGLLEAARLVSQYWAHDEVRSPSS